MIFSIGIIIALFLSFLLLTKKGKTQKDYLLFAWLIAIALNLCLFYFQINNLHYQHPIVLGWLFPIPLMHWPFIYLYICSLTSKSKLTVKSLFHFLPFFLSIALFTPFYLSPIELKIEIYKSKGAGYESQMLLNFIAILASAITYTVLSAIKLLKYRKAIKSEFSNTDKINLNWLIYLLIGMTIILTVVIFNLTDKYIYTAVVGLVIFIGYFGIKQVGVFSQNSPASSEFDNEIISRTDSHFDNIDTHSKIDDRIVPIYVEASQVKYQKSALSEKRVDEIYEELKTVMSTDRLYQNSELTLGELANKMNVLPNYLSQVINSKENKNFFDYINCLRVEEFCVLIGRNENQKYTLLSIAYDCGFNSKSSFNRNFKKVTGLTPSEFVSRKKR